MNLRTALLLAAWLCLPGLLIAADVGPSFENEVIPVLTRFNCNMGACHGKGAGQNGFRLSLRGFAPEQDHRGLTREFSGRRLSGTVPSDSLLLKKAAGLMPHGGGRVFAVDSPAYRLLAQWIEAGAPGPQTNAAKLHRLEVATTAGAMKPGEQRTLTVRAHFDQGAPRDVTWLCKFFSNDDSVLEVSPEGRVTCLRSGETSIRVHFLEFVEVVTFTAPYENPVAADLFQERRNVVDEHVMAKLAELKLPPAPVTDDASFLRRAFLDTIGLPPSADEMRAFLQDSRADKRARWIDDLLARPEFTDYWTLQLADLLQNRKERDHDCRGAKGVRQLHAWLREQVAANKGWHEIAQSILTSQGDSFDRPQVGYFIVTVGEQREAERSEVVASVAQTFLGTRIGCAQCHNHPLERYTQDDYYHFAAFFSRVALNRGASKENSTVLWPVSQDRANHWRQRDNLERRIAELTRDGTPTDEALKKELDNQQQQLAGVLKQLEQFKERPVRVHQPRTGQQLPPRPLDRSAIEVPDDADPRQPLVNWMTAPQNDYFSGAMVNRLWKHFFQTGLVEPVDDLRPSNPPSNPALWTSLNREFVQSGYQLKAVMRLILNSRTYQLSSESSPANVHDRRYYSHYYARRLPAEVLSDAISQVTGVPDEFPGYPVGMRAVQIPDPSTSSYFLSLFGRSERVTACACERTGDVTLPQLLHMQNGDWITRKLRQADSTVHSLAQSKLPEGELIEAIYLRTLGRLPTRAERETVEPFFKANEDRASVVADVFWTLLNSREFAFNH